MAISFDQKEIKKAKFPVIAVVFAILLIVAFAVWFFFLRETNEPQTEAPAQEVSSTWKKIDIDFNILQNPKFTELQNFDKIPEYTGAVGKENPFK